MRIGRAESPTSNALRRLRGSVSLACAMVAAALLVQMLVWAFATFTDVRFAQASGPTAAQREPTVVHNNQQSNPDDATWAAPASSNEPNVLNADQLAASESPIEAAAVNINYSSADSWLRTLNQLAIALAVIGLLLLAFETSLGVVVAGGTVAPGVGRVTRAQLWSALLVSLAIPWDKFIPAFPVPPLLSNYADMIATTEAFRQQDAYAISAGAFYGQFLLMPLAALAGVNIAGWSFWQGASTAVVSEAPTAFEQAIEEEAHDREAGNVRYGGRAGGALQLAMNDERPLARSGKKSKQPQPEPKPEVNIGLMTGTGSLVASGPNAEADDQIPSLSATAPAEEPPTMTLASLANESEDDDYRRPI